MKCDDNGNDGGTPARLRDASRPREATAGLPIDTIICGDNVATMARFPAEVVDLVVTSPPYDDLRTYDGHDWNFHDVARELVRIIKPGGVVVWVVGDATVDGSETGSSFRQALHFMEIGFRLHDTMIYRKRNAIPLTHNRYEQEFEFMFILSRGSPKTFNPMMERCESGKTGTFRQRDGQLTRGHSSVATNQKQRGNVWEYLVGKHKSTTDSFAFAHPATFPERLARDHVVSWSNPGDLVVDPFNGSGTTTKVAKLLGRRFIGIDVSPTYCRIARKRIAQGVLPLTDDRGQQ